MSRVKALVVSTFLASSMIGPASAQSIRVTPVSIDLPLGATSSVLTLSTENQESVAVQARVFRWSQVDGEERLEKTEDVVVSPPVLSVRGSAPSTLRLVRVAKTPVSGEETYRVLIDEIPDRKKLQSGGLALVVRQSLPVFFGGFDASPASITYKAVQRKSKLFLEATNAGQKRLKVMNLTVLDEKKHDVLKINGMAGYVLGGQRKAWQLPGLAMGKTLAIKAESDAAPINASVVVGGGQSGKKG